MKSLVFAPLIVALASAGAVPAKVNYDGFKVVRLGVGNKVADVTALIDRLSLSSWTGKPKENGVIDLVVPPEHLAAFDKATNGLHTEVMHEDLGASVAVEGAFVPHTTGAVDLTWFNSYHSYDDHLKWLNDLQAAFPSNSEIIVSGKSSQGRPITGIHLYGSSGKNNKPAIVWHGTVHAREWITTMVVEYLTYSLLSNYTTDPQIKQFVDSYDFHIFPVANPDGFIYAQTTDRMWRKNRVPSSSSSCVGTDINRNWDAFWDVPGGSSTNPCAQDYRGISPADQSETRAHQDYLQKLHALPNGIKVFTDFHSYSQLFMTPYGYTCNAVPPNNDEHQRLAKAFATALQGVSGTRFTTGPVCTTIYQTSGASGDYAYDKAKAEFAFAAELRDTGRFGFVLPPAQILPSGIETFAGYRALLANLK
jgi:murein tripeptide amidase MpaA